MKQIFVILILIVLISGFYIIGLKIKPSLTFSQSQSQNDVYELKGWAWSGGGNDPNSGIGWISFNCEDTNSCSTSDYEVVIDKITGEFSGYAWSENIGWISFNKFDLFNCPKEPCSLTVENPEDLGQKQVAVIGWARVLSVKDNSNNGGWDGWIRFDHGKDNAVYIDKDGNFHGYAWTDMVAGWISFEGVSINLTPVQATPSCTLSASPTIGPAPLTATFTITINNCDNLTSIDWDGPCTLISSTNASCTYTYATSGTYGPYTATTRCSNGSVITVTCTSPTITVTSTPSNFDLSVSDLDIRSFICKNRDFDQSFWNEFSAQNPNYMFAPSTTYATQFYNNVASSTCPESQINRPVEFSATGTCLKGPCPESKLRIKIYSTYMDADNYETTTSFDAKYPKSVKGTYVFDKAYDYTVKACLVDKNNDEIKDDNNSNNCQEKTLSIFNYFCYYGYCAQSQRNPQNSSTFLKIIKVFTDTDSPCRFWRNEICRARFGF